MKDEARSKSVARVHPSCRSGLRREAKDHAGSAAIIGGTQRHQTTWGKTGGRIDGHRLGGYLAADDRDVPASMHGAVQRDP